MIQPEYNELGDLSVSASSKVKLSCAECWMIVNYKISRTVAALSHGTIGLSEFFSHAHSLQFSQPVRVCYMTVRFCLATRT